MAFYMKHNHYWEEMLEEKNLNVKHRNAFYAKDWDFYTIACEILKEDGDGDGDECVKIDEFLDIKIVADELLMNTNDNQSDADESIVIDVNENNNDNKEGKSEGD